MEDAVALVPLEDLPRAVLRPIVGGNDDVDTRVEVKGDLCVDDVGLVPREERHRELHRESR